MNNFVITLARQYGSGGRELGQKLADDLGYKYYDRDLISLAAQKSGYNLEALSEVDEKAASSLLYTLSYGPTFYADGLTQINLPLNDKLFAVQSDIIRDIYKKGKGAVIVGRCADYVLADKENILNVYVISDFDNRVQRIMKRNEISESQAKDKIIKTDKRRANYYNYYTGRKWGRIENYDLIINIDKTGADGAVNVIKAYIESVKE